MKKIILFVTLLISFNAKSQTSVYHPFPDSAANWNIVSHRPCGLGFDMWEYNYSIVISGDTLINGNTYHKLDIPVQVIETHGACNSNGTLVSPGYYAGCIRQDTSIKKVFFVPPSDSVEWLLYDFNMAVGDSVKGYTGTFAFPVEVVQNIDSVLVGNSYRKRWIINSC
jgi:hypothetical protein